MKLYLFSVIATLMISQSGIAKWQEVRTQTFRARSAAQVASVLSDPAFSTWSKRLTDQELKYRKLAGLPDRFIKSLEVTLKTYRWIGDHGCPSEYDKRLIYTSSKAKFSYSDESNPQWETEELEDKDPCQ